MHAWHQNLLWDLEFKQLFGTLRHLTTKILANSVIKIVVSIVCIIKIIIQAFQYY